MAKQKREVEVVVLSDIHLGTYGCHAKELVAYLKSVSPKVLILNGDVIDGWAFSYPQETISELCFNALSISISYI